MFTGVEVCLDWDGAGFGCCWVCLGLGCAGVEGLDPNSFFSNAAAALAAFSAFFAFLNACFSSWLRFLFASC